MWCTFSVLDALARYSSCPARQPPPTPQRCHYALPTTLCPPPSPTSPSSFPLLSCGNHYYPTSAPIAACSGQVPQNIANLCSRPCVRVSPKGTAKSFLRHTSKLHARLE
ncbi:Piso0_000361 [Millerozyma farinosa CBS 7064]|uniref:Piso0_000361 protein n=1 Tax=Pichia sorbitophila (strain ATCC MYA-4447 / BCRC 22081 / CBS 7064 / NBRC 10061 / NRRL Y-12695) TaxID=559304 RepID=G8YTS7_PICSO|nr:Piso0_000361 [Millerozyma farinosa CBS 7064]CCE73328.1 Piso0_000361 [Millerozyma farinosa CBS 7064]